LPTVNLLALPLNKKVVEPLWNNSKIMIC
jgi:hypothetical protein